MPLDYKGRKALTHTADLLFIEGTHSAVFLLILVTAAQIGIVAHVVFPVHSVSVAVHSVLVLHVFHASLSLRLPGRPQFSLDFGTSFVGRFDVAGLYHTSIPMLWISTTKRNC